MQLHDSVIICANAVVVWPFIADPVLQADWNPKIVSVNRPRSGPARFGERFEMIYHMSGRENVSQVEVTDCQPSQRIVFVHRSMWKAAEQVVQEIYEISPHDRGVKVAQAIDLTATSIPWVLRPVIGLVCRLGTNVEEDYLQRLKRLVEGPVPAA